MQDLKANKRVLIASVAAVILALIVGLVFVLNPSCSHSANPLPNPTASPTPLPTNYPATNVKPAVPGYMRTNSDSETKIYIVSASSMYGSYPEDVIQQITNETVVHKGDPCFILNLTLRSDYIDNETIPSTAGALDFKNQGAAWIILNASLFDQNGEKINVTNITHVSVPFHNRDQFSLRNGGTEIINIVLATPNRGINHFNIAISYMGPLPEP